jgi:F-type H+-transporting ATPase subunit gamma
MGRSAPYQKKLREMMADLAGAAGEVSHPLLVSRTVKKSSIFVITSNRGMCAGYNVNLCHTARDVMTHEREQGAATELHVVGKKGTQYFRHRGEEAAASYVQFGDRIPYAEVNRIAEGLIERYSAAEIDRVTIVYQKFHSAGRQAPVAEVLLPLSTIATEAPTPAAPAAAAGAATAETSWAANYIFSPDPAALMQELLPAYTKSMLWASFLQASVGEQRARMVAMKNATDAADKLIKQLTRLYNRARQSQITNEIAELMGGVEALK